MFTYHLKLSTRFPIKRFHPSTRTKIRILNGKEIITGGSIIIPILISTELTTISITKNGKKIKKPISKAI